MQYCENDVDCRRVQTLSHFGEHFSSVSVNCLEGVRRMNDTTKLPFALTSHLCCFHVFPCAQEDCQKRCDNCMNAPANPSSEPVTEYAKSILRIVRAMPQRGVEVKMQTVVSIFRGSAAKGVVMFKESVYDNGSERGEQRRLCACICSC